MYGRPIATAATRAPTTNAAPRIQRRAFTSVREQYRQRRIQDEVPGHAAEDHLAETALRIGALDDEIGTDGNRGVDDRLASRARAWLDVLARNVEAVRGERRGNLRRRRARHHRAIDAQYLDRVGSA